MTDTDDAIEAHYFSIDEANKTLPLVSAIVGDIVELHGDLEERRDRLELIRNRLGRKRQQDVTDDYMDELQVSERQLEADVNRLEGFVDELRRLGVVLKDAKRGLVDYRSSRDGQDVYLCWMHGEEEIGHWHGLDEGFEDRQSLFESAGPRADS